MEIHRHRVWGRETSDEKWDAISESYLKVNESITKIRLRLNPTEEPSKEILSLLNEYEKAFSDNGIPSQEDLSKLNHNFVEASQRLLKSEWNRVRNGEVVFRVVRAASFAILISGLIALFHQLYMQRPLTIPSRGNPQAALLGSHPGYGGALTSNMEGVEKRSTRKFNS
jgi:hypothetical protein